MPKSGAYEFRLASIAKDGLVADENAHLIPPGEWAWIDRTAEFASLGKFERFLMIYAMCPDCGQLMTLYRKRGEGEPEGHKIDSEGNVHPSVLHTWKMNGVEQCGFHTQPTKLLGFVDLRQK
jgi:hypothetical protein